MILYPPLDALKTPSQHLVCFFLPPVKGNRVKVVMTTGFSPVNSWTELSSHSAYAKPALRLFKVPTLHLFCLYFINDNIFYFECT
ncbi:hypothetical protein HanHA89_Chr17g0725521 [Helianthus annuus]|nr:hypothetical protein HanHA89_Chr17g0725521 [Helianthus annuus]